MKKIIIFEGIAASGKTTLEKCLQKHLINSTIISEEITLMPIIENKDPNIAINHLLDVLARLKNCTTDYLIIDRFHITHAFRTNASVETFQQIENEIKKYQSTIIFLKISDSNIPDRIRETTQRRGSSWKKGKQGTIDERIEYYKNQQKILTDLIKSSTLSSITIDTSNKSWEDYMSKLLEIIK